MKKFVKILLGSALLIIVLFAAAIAYVLLVIDPNDYKQQIQEAAAEQGIALKFSGDLGWQIVPNLAIRIGETHISSTTQAIPDTSFKSASLSLAWGPLLRKQVHISAIAIDGADILISSGDEAVTTAAAPLAATGDTGTEADPDGAETNEAGADKEAIGIAVDAIEITNSRITLPGEGQPLVLDKVFFEGEGINLEGRSFPISLSFDYSDGSLPEALNIMLDTELSVDLENDELTVTGLNLSSSGLKLSADVTVAQMSTAPDASGSIQLPNTDLKAVLDKFGVALPDMPDKKALTRVGLSAEFSGSAEQVKIPSLELRVDDTTITAEVSGKLQAPKQLSITLSGDAIDLNRYLAASETETGETDTDNAAQNQAQLIFAPLIAPLALLDGGNGTFDFSWGKVLMDGLSVDTIHLAATTKGATINISDFSANTLGGSIKSTARLGNLKGKRPNLNYTAELNNISLSEATKAFAEGIDTSGTLTAAVKGKSKGATADQLFDKLSSDGSLQIIDPELKTINIEQSYCQVAAMVEKKTAKQDWPPGTKLNNVDGKFRMQGRTLLLDGLSSGVGNLKLNANGEVDLGAGTFNILAVTRLDGEQTSETGCVVESTKLRNKDLPLRCKDSFEKAGAKSCLPDGDFVKQIMKDEIFDKIGDKAGLKEEDKKAVDSLLKGLFGN